METYKPVVSVILPLYSETDEYIYSSVNSVLTSTYSNFELIIIVDTPQGTKDFDRISSLLKSFNDDRLIITFNMQNIGPAMSLNKGIDMSRGEYIAIMHGDDICMPNRLEEQLRFLEENPEFDMCGSMVIYIDEHSKELGRSNCISQYEIARRLFSGMNTLTHATFFGKKEFFRDLGGYRDLAPVEDYDLLCRAFISGKKFACLDKPLLKSRIHTHNSRLSMHLKPYIPCLVFKCASKLSKGISIDRLDFIKCIDLYKNSHIRLMINKWDNFIFRIALSVREKNPTLFNFMKPIIYIFSPFRVTYHAKRFFRYHILFHFSKFKKEVDKWVVKSEIKY